MIIRPAPPEHLPWLVNRVKYHPTSQLRAIESIGSDGAIRAMVGFDNWMPNSLEMHFATDIPSALRPLIRPAYDYAFNFAKREYVIALCPASRVQALKWAERSGFKEIHRLKNGCAVGDDLVYTVLHRDDCRWLKPRRN